MSSSDYTPELEDGNQQTAFEGADCPLEEPQEPTIWPRRGGEERRTVISSANSCYEFVPLL